jgi:hypothetical protein
MMKRRRPLKLLPTDPMLEQYSRDLDLTIPGEASGNRSSVLRFGPS